MTKIDELGQKKPGRVRRHLFPGAVKARCFTIALPWGLKLATACVLLAFVSSQAANALDDVERFQFSAGFDNDRRHLIDPIGNERDENGNLVRVDSLSRDGGTSSKCGLLSSAIGNLLSVVVDGNNNTVIVNSTQTNTGDITATSSLNGRIQLPCF